MSICPIFEVLPECGLTGCSWFVVGQLMAPVALNELNATHPYDFKTAIYTQWAMIGITIIIYVLLPESPCEQTCFPRA